MLFRKFNFVYSYHDSAIIMVYLKIRYPSYPYFTN